MCTVNGLAQTVAQFMVAIAYMVCHSVVILFQFVTLTVAINSKTHALLTIIISNQFVELKGSVFKRIAVNNLFQISCTWEFFLSLFF